MGGELGSNVGFCFAYFPVHCLSYSILLCICIDFTLLFFLSSFHLRVAEHTSTVLCFKTDALCINSQTSNLGGCTIRTHATKLTN